MARAPPRLRHGAASPATPQRRPRTCALLTGCEPEHRQATMTANIQRDGGKAWRAVLRISTACPATVGGTCCAAVERALGCCDQSGRVRCRPRSSGRPTRSRTGSSWNDGPRPSSSIALLAGESGHSPGCTCRWNNRLQLMVRLPVKRALLVKVPCCWFVSRWWWVSPVGCYLAISRGDCVHPQRSACGNLSEKERVTPRECARRTDISSANYVAPSAAAAPPGHNKARTHRAARSGQDVPAGTSSRDGCAQKMLTPAGAGRSL